MRQTVVGVFDGFDAARTALDALARDSFEDHRVHATETAAEPAPHAGDDSVLATLRHFFGELFSAEHHYTPYADAMRRGGAVVRVDVDDSPQAVRAELAFVRAGAIDITRQGVAWDPVPQNPLSALQEPRTDSSP